MTKHSSDDDRDRGFVGPSVPKHEIDENGNYVPEGTMQKRWEEKEMQRMKAEAAEEFYEDEIPSNDDTALGFNVYENSRRYKAAGSNREDKLLSDIVRQRLDKECARAKKDFQREATEGFKGKLNSFIPFVSLSPSADELAHRKREHSKNARAIHEKSVRVSRKRIKESPLDIMVDGDSEWRAPAVGIGSDKGGSGKTTTITALCQHYAATLAKRKIAGRSGRPSVLVDLNPADGAVINRVPGAINKNGERLDTLELGTACLIAEKNGKTFDALSRTYPTDLSYLCAVPNPTRLEERRKVSHDHVRAIYQSLSPHVSMFFMDNGAVIDSRQSVSSVAVANAFVLVVEAGAQTHDVLRDISKYQELRSEFKSFEGVTERIVVAIVNNRVASKKLHANADHTRSELKSKGIPSVIIPYERRLADSDHVVLSDLSIEYKSAIASLAAYILGNITK